MARSNGPRVDAWEATHLDLSQTAASMLSSWRAVHPQHSVRGATHRHALRTVALLLERVRLLERDLEHETMLACQSPAPDCGCPGCLYAAEYRGSEVDGE